MAAAAIGAVGSIAGGVASGKGAKKAAKIQAKTAAENREFATKMYDQTVDMFNPEVVRGNEAGGALSALLGLGAGSNPALTMTKPIEPTAPVASQFKKMKNYNAAMQQYYNSPAYIQYSRDLAAYNSAVNAPQISSATTSRDNAQSAYDTFKASTGYQTTMNDALESVNANAYAKGAGNSGAALKALQDRSAQIANGTFGDYYNRVAGIAGTGTAVKGNIAGASQNLTNTVIGSNTNAANAQSNAAIAQGNSLAGMIGNLTNLAGSALGSSYKTGGK